MTVRLPPDYSGPLGPPGAVLAHGSADPPLTADHAGDVIANLIELVFNPFQLRDDKGRWTKIPGTGAEHAVTPQLGPTPGPAHRHYPEIGEEGNRGNSRPVSSAEFQHLAALGNAWIDRSKRDASPITGMDQHWAEIKHRAFTEAQQSWGGATIDSHSGEFLAHNADKYAISVKPRGMHTISVPEHATEAEFNAAMDRALAEFRPALERETFHLGVFHDDDMGRIDIDPVAILDTPEDVEKVGAYTRAIGGAYHFATGNGYWPPHVEERIKAMATTTDDGTVQWAGPGEWHREAVAIQDPEPEDPEPGIAEQMNDDQPIG